MDPYLKIKDGVEYPSVLLTHGANDSRVPVWMSAKMAARLQSAFLAVGVQGQPLQIIPRERWLENLKFYKVHSYSIDDIKVHVYGDTAVVLMLYTQKATVGRTPRDLSAQFVLTDIWAKRKDGWRVAERHSSRPEQPRPPQPKP